MKATLFVLALSVLGGCRASRLGQDPVIRNAFAAQAQPEKKPTVRLDATDGSLIMARHREPMQPPQTGTGQPAAGLVTPMLGGK